MADGLRLDKFLWFARIAKTRALARQLAEGGRIRIGGRIIDRAHAPVRVGDVMSFAQRGAVRVLRIEALPARRGPPVEARALYTEVAEAASESPLCREGDGKPPLTGAATAD
ncbi:MAG TPA: S4 domain-containing protein [Allosphingosinicella sp.]|nr:S4 domain-containing protein [Allosphingosinicella sp.]